MCNDSVIVCNSCCWGRGGEWLDNKKSPFSSGVGGVSGFFEFGRTSMIDVKVLMYCTYIDFFYWIGIFFVKCWVQVSMKYGLYWMYFLFVYVVSPTQIKNRYHNSIESCHNTIKHKHTKALEMRIHWVLS